MRDRSIHLRRTGLAFVLALSLVGIGQSALAQEDSGADIQPSATFELSGDPSEVVISMTERIHMLVMPTYPSVRIYADGRVVRHMPAGFQNEGDNVGRISQSELNALVESLVNGGVLEFDRRATLERKRAVDQASNTFHHISDVSTIEIEVRLASYQPAAAAAPTVDFERTLRWDGLRHDAVRYTGLSELQNLAAAYQQLEALAQRVERESRQGGGS